MILTNFLMKTGNFKTFFQRWYKGPNLPKRLTPKEPSTAGSWRCFEDVQKSDISQRVHISFPPC